MEPQVIEHSQVSRGSLGRSWPAVSEGCVPWALLHFVGGCCVSVGGACGFSTLYEAVMKVSVMKV